MIPARLRPRTIEGRIAALTFVLLAFLLTLVGILVDHEVWEGERRALDRRLTSEAEALAALTYYDGSKIVLDLGDDMITAFAASAPRRRVGFFQVWSAAGLVERSHTSPSVTLPPPDEVLLAPLESIHDRRTRWSVLETPTGLMRVLSLAVARVHGGARGGPAAAETAPRETVVVQVARRYAEVEHDRGEVQGALAFAIPLALLIGTLGSFGVARRATAPISRLGREASEVGTGSLDQRLDLATVEGELLELARALNGAFDRLSGAVARERRFSSDVAHELRTPLSITRSTLELALSRERSPEEYRAAIQQGLDANGRLESIVSSLLLLGRAESVVLVRKSLDLRVVVAAAVDSLGALARRAGVTVKITAPEVPCWVLGHSTLLERLVANLVENALRHGASPAGVEVTLVLATARVVLTVRDRGPGFPEGFAARAFERFARADDSRARASGGAGLGLSIARAIVGAHNGEIAAAPRVGGGAEIVVRLPLLESGAGAGA